LIDLKKVKGGVIAFNGSHSRASLPSVTCRMGSHSVTCHPTRVNALRLNLNQIGRYRFIYSRGMEG